MINFIKNFCKIKSYMFSILGNHCKSIVAVLALSELELGHRVEELGQMFGDLQRLVAVGQDVEEVVGGRKVESGKGQTFRLQIFGQRLFAERQLGLDDFEFLDQSCDVGGLVKKYS